METANWGNEFVRVINGHNPPLVGLVGPNHKGGNLEVMTYEFTHHTHVDIFGYHYPRVFTDWFADEWTTFIYQPKRATKLMHVTLLHTMSLGRRYDVRWENKPYLKIEVEKGRNIIERYVQAVRARNVSGRLSAASDGRRVIAMSLFGNNPRYTWGVIRNAQLVPVYFPGWRLRVYVPQFSTKMPELSVPLRVIRKLKQLGADVARVRIKTGGLSPRDWRLLAADDQSIEYFLIRNADSRLSDREFSAVNEWIAEVEKNINLGYRDSLPVHCIKDHPEHAKHAVVDGLWGGRPEPLYRKIGNKLTTAILQKMWVAGVKNSNLKLEQTTNSSQLAQGPQTVLEMIMSSLIGGDDVRLMFHDVVSPCDKTHLSSKIVRRPFPMPRNKMLEYVGQKYDEYQDVMANEANRPTIPEIVCT